MNLKSTKLFLTALIVLVAIFSKAQTVQVDKVLAVVGDNIILQSDVESQFQSMSSQSQGAIDPSERCTIFDNLLLERLFLAQAILDSVTTTPEEVEAELDRRIKYFISVFGSKEKLEEYYGKSILELKDDFKEDIEKQLISDKMKGKAFAGLKVSPAEVKEFFDRIPKDSIPYFNSEIELGQIVMFPKVNEQQKEYARKKIEGIRNEIIQGAEFDVKAIQYSEDPGSYLDGGNLGIIERGDMVKEFEAAAYRIKEGEVSDIVETAFGFHILKVDEIRGDKRKVRHILIKPKMMQSDARLVQEKMDSILHQLRVDSLSWREAVNQYSEDEQSKSVGGMMTNSKTGTSFFEKADIDGTLIFTIDRMKVGEYSEVLTYASMDRTGQGMDGYRIIFLKSETKPHQASLEEDYSKIQAAARGEKQQLALENWMKLHKARNYIRIDDSMKHCPQMEKWLEK